MARNRSYEIKTTNGYGSTKLPTARIVIIIKIRNFSGLQTKIGAEKVSIVIKPE